MDIKSGLASAGNEGWKPVPFPLARGGGEGWGFMGSAEDRRKGLRASVPAEFYFNILSSPEEYTRGHTSILKRLGAIDSVKAPAARPCDQRMLLPG